MSTSNLQGLDVVHPAQHSSDSHDLLLGQVYPNLASQLELWTNLAFDSEEQLAPRHEEHKNAAKSTEDEEKEEGEEARSPVSRENLAVHDGHVNVVNPANVQIPSLNHLFAAQPAGSFDIESFMNSLGIDSFPNHTTRLHQQEPPAITPSLAQLLMLRPPCISAFGAGLSQYIDDAAAPLSFTRPTSIPTEERYPPRATVKRTRTRRASVTSTKSPNSYEDSIPPNPNLSPTEDKRRRNTAASARFRLKKKEREAALEGKAKNLESKVTELERECQDLRRENGWLKGLVVSGVTGTTAQGISSTVRTVSSESPPPVTISTTTEPNGTNQRKED